MTRADFSLARELVLGFSCDLLPVNDSYWTQIGRQPVHTFEEAARRALQTEPSPQGLRGFVGQVEEALIQTIGERLGRRQKPGGRGE